MIHSSGSMKPEAGQKISGNEKPIRLAVGMGYQPN